MAFRHGYSMDGTSIQGSKEENELQEELEQDQEAEPEVEGELEPKNEENVTETQAETATKLRDRPEAMSSNDTNREDLQPTQDEAELSRYDFQPSMRDDLPDHRKISFQDMQRIISVLVRKC